MHCYTRHDAGPYYENIWLYYNFLYHLNNLCIISYYNKRGMFDYYDTLRNETVQARYIRGQKLSRFV